MGPEEVLRELLESERQFLRTLDEGLEAFADYLEREDGTEAEREVFGRVDDVRNFHRGCGAPRRTIKPRRDFFLNLRSVTDSA